MRITAYECVAMLALACVMGLAVVAYRASTTAILIGNESGEYLRDVTITADDQILWRSDIAPRDSVEINAKWPGGNVLRVQISVEDDDFAPNKPITYILQHVDAYTLDTQVISLLRDDASHFQKPWL